MQHHGHAPHDEVANLRAIQGIEYRLDLANHRQEPSSGLISNNLI